MVGKGNTQIFMYVRTNQLSCKAKALFGTKLLLYYVFSTAFGFMLTDSLCILGELHLRRSARVLNGTRPSASLLQPLSTIALLRRRRGGEGRRSHIVKEEAISVSHRRIDGDRDGDVPPGPENVPLLIEDDQLAAAVNDEDGAIGAMEVGNDMSVNIILNREKIINLLF